MAKRLIERAAHEEQVALDAGEKAAHLNAGQRASLRAIAESITKHGLVLGDEVGIQQTLRRCEKKAPTEVAHA